MKKPVHITKNPDLEPSQDYAFLREKGMKHIEHFSSELWTDFNPHDPGTTMMELLCYAITDLGYRTGYDMKELLADQSAPGNGQQFHTARDILTTKPVTEHDFRKLLIDVEGVKNAWLQPLEETTPPLYLNTRKGKWEEESDDENTRINLLGLYDVTLELDEDEEAGDLNKFSFETSIDTEDNEATKITTLLPDWSYWLNHGLLARRQEEITSLSLKELEEFGEDDRFRFDAVIEIESSTGTSYEKEIEIRVSRKDESIGDVEPGMNDIILPAYQVKLEKALNIAWKAYRRLHANRSLCEDFENFRALDVEEIGVCADIKLESEAELERVLAEIYYRMERHLAPPVYFYSLNEMMDKDISTEEIFEGPALDHGFITSEELDHADIKKEIYVSDILQILMDVEGVKTVNNLLLNNAWGEEIRNRKIEWERKVGDNRVPRFSIDHSDIDLFKENLPYRPNSKKVERYLTEMEQMERSRKLSADDDYDFPVPQGEDRGLTQYTSVQQQLPLNYGVSDAGIPGVITDQRLAQAKQLKAYLTFYDQLLANYLAQLANVKNLFSFSKKVHRTYYYQVLFEEPQYPSFPGEDTPEDVLFSEEGSPRIQQVIRDFLEFVEDDTGSPPEPDNFKQLKVKWEDYWDTHAKNRESHFVRKLDGIVEDEQTFYERRNRFLDHLLARFGESFTDYVLLMYSREEGPRLASELVEDKIEFLQEYPMISACRGQAFNYKDDENLWNTGNVSGLEKRLTKLLGIEHYNRRALSGKDVNELFEIFKDSAGEWRFRLKLEDGTIVLRSEAYTRKEKCRKGIEAVKRNGTTEENYTLKEASDGRFYFTLQAKNNEIIATGIIYDQEENRRKDLISCIEALKKKEGFHLVEHILLRPKQIDGPKLPACKQTKGRACPGYSDPYSFRISLIVPYWPARFDDMAFRKFMAKTIRKEAPAHTHLKICWVSRDDMKDFEKAYRAWLEVKAQAHPGEEELQAKLAVLIDVMRRIRSVYPDATLHDFQEDSDDNPMLLNNTVLGTFKPE